MHLDPTGGRGRLPWGRPSLGTFSIYFEIGFQPIKTSRPGFPAQPPEVRRLIWTSGFTWRRRDHAKGRRERRRLGEQGGDALGRCGRAEEGAQAAEAGQRQQWVVRLCQAAVR
eukprot:scaffold498_cov348-Pinguiococcus_pyrenoidosus.AAC.7